MKKLKLRARLVHFETAMSGECIPNYKEQHLRVHFTSPEYKDTDIEFTAFHHLAVDEMLTLTYTLCYLLGEEVQLEYVEDDDDWLLHGISPVRDIAYGLRYGKWFSEENRCS